MHVFFKLALTFIIDHDKVENVLKYLKVKILNMLRDIRERLLFSTSSKQRKLSQKWDLKVFDMKFESNQLDCRTLYV